MTKGGAVEGGRQVPSPLPPPCRSTDPNQDLDQDGFTPKQGDCDDCNPEVNPNAVEVRGDSVDNDCNGMTDEAPPLCDKNAPGKKEAIEIAHSMELCDPRFFKGATMTGPSNEQARNVLASFGLLKPRAGGNFALLSNGVAVDAKGSGFRNPQEGTDLKTAEFDNPLPNLMGAADCGQSSVGGADRQRALGSRARGSGDGADRLTYALSPLPAMRG